MAVEKKDVRKLNLESPTFRRLAARGAKGLGDLLDASITALNLVLDSALVSLNGVLGAAGCATGTTKSKAKTANTVAYKVNGEVYSLAGSDDFWTLTGTVFGGSSVQAKGWLLCVDNAGAASVVATAVASAIASLVWPAVPASKSVVGYLTVITDGANAFTPGTTLLDATGITADFGDGVPEAMGRALKGVKVDALA